MGVAMEAPMTTVVEEIGGEPVVRALVERFYHIIETAPEQLVSWAV